MKLRRLYLNLFWQMDIGHGTAVSMSAILDRTNPRGVHVGEHTAIAFDAVILTHDFVNMKHHHTRVGSYCLIGARSLVYPGVTIGDHVIVAAASVVMKDVPSHSVVSGNPARVIETGIMTGKRGFRVERPKLAAAEPKQEA